VPNALAKLPSFAKKNHANEINDLVFANINCEIGAPEMTVFGYARVSTVDQD
jgi:hypothetical protein